MSIDGGARTRSPPAPFTTPRDSVKRVSSAWLLNLRGGGLLLVTAVCARLSGERSSLRDKPLPGAKAHLSTPAWPSGSAGGLDTVPGQYRRLDESSNIRGGLAIALQVLSRWRSGCVFCDRGLWWPLLFARQHKQAWWAGTGHTPDRLLSVVLILTMSSGSQLSLIGVLVRSLPVQRHRTCLAFR